MLNSIDLIGRMVRDPEVKATKAGVSVCTFTIACDRDYVPDGGERECDFIDITAWRTVADFVGRYFTKGKLITISGRLQTRTYQDKDGKNRKISEVLAEHVWFTGDKSSSESANGHDTASGKQAAQKQSEQWEDITSDDIPF